MTDQELYSIRQNEIDTAETRERADDWLRHVTVLEQKRAEREPGYVPHAYRPKGPPSRGDKHVA